MTEDDMYEPDLDQVWNDLWDSLHDQGMADVRGGAEYYRCYQAWVKAGRPIGAIGFYSYGLANQQPKGKGVGNGSE